jgi:hypothetical protein
METTSLGQRRRVPGFVVDAGLAVATALAVAVAIRASPEPSGPPEGLAYLVGSTIAALALARRRWPLAVLLVSAVTLQLYYLLDFPGIFPAVPLAVALFTAWAAGHRGWSLAVTAWFVAAPVAFRTLVANEALVPVLSDAVRDAALFAPNAVNEPALAIDANHPTVLASGGNDLVDSAPCNGSSCDLTPDIGISGIYFSLNEGASWVQPTYTGLTAHSGTPQVGPIHTPCPGTTRTA